MSHIAGFGAVLTYRKAAVSYPSTSSTSLLVSNVAGSGVSSVPEQPVVVFNCSDTSITRGALSQAMYPSLGRALLAGVLQPSSTSIHDPNFSLLETGAPGQNKAFALVSMLLSPSWPRPWGARCVLSGSSRLLACMKPLGLSI